MIVIELDIAPLQEPSRKLIFLPHSSPFPSPSLSQDSVDNKLVAINRHSAAVMQPCNQAKDDINSTLYYHFQSIISAASNSVYSVSFWPVLCHDLELPILSRSSPQMHLPALAYFLRQTRCVTRMPLKLMKHGNAPKLPF